MTEELFREDSYLKSCEAKVVAVSEEGIVLDRTVFYPTGGGQPGDVGTLTTEDGRTVPVADTRKGKTVAGIVHVPADGAPALADGDSVTATLDWERRHRLMRMHTAMHILCSLVDGGVTGGQVGDAKSRLDFNLEPENVPDKDALTEKLNAVIAGDHAVTIGSITDAELESNPDLVRTMSVKPPTGAGTVRMIRIGDDVDYQPCGGTHVKATAEIGRLEVTKIENKGKQNRRINIALVD
ncbi:alanyl-tRNA editing protein [Thalassobaculum litoreum]|uniref:Alanine--tRNA ligase n=1 Tax=Thalassobaculum litoreum DSM 18839 TaxID=1123362 RepID=A0A8G2BHR3_9PROT|nr:alanyl-tRNA editing protein [Thalassobaculum litoreum]SDF77365.1 misacylated tRNA(Ala) deacylase [Thalassobaculum litoreum DSM 18839]